MKLQKSIIIIGMVASSILLFGSLLYSFSNHSQLQKPQTINLNGQVSRVVKSFQRMFAKNVATHPSKKNHNRILAGAGDVAVVVVGGLLFVACFICLPLYAKYRSKMKSNKGSTGPSFFRPTPTAAPTPRTNQQGNNYNMEGLPNISSYNPPKQHQQRAQPRAPTQNQNTNNSRPFAPKINVSYSNNRSSAPRKEAPPQTIKIGAAKVKKGSYLPKKVELRGKAGQYAPKFNHKDTGKDFDFGGMKVPMIVPPHKFSKYEQKKMKELANKLERKERTVSMREKARRAKEEKEFVRKYGKEDRYIPPAVRRKMQLDILRKQGYGREEGKYRAGRR